MHLPLIGGTDCGLWVDGCVETLSSTPGEPAAVVFDNSKVQSFINYEEYETVAGQIRSKCGNQERFVRVPVQPQKTLAMGDFTFTDNKEKQFKVLFQKAQLKDAEAKIALLKNSDHPLYTTKENLINLMLFRCINFACWPVEFVAVVGLVGLGKSTLLCALFGGIKAGSSFVGRIEGGSVVYATQTPFIVNNSICENFLFGLL